MANSRKSRSEWGVVENGSPRPKPLRKSYPSGAEKQGQSVRIIAF